MKKKISNPESLRPRYFEIKEDPLVGFYLYVFEGHKCIYDHLQDTLEIAIECAWEDYGVPKTSWEKINRICSDHLYMHPE